jgi:diguanylate cyclase (GGDEF)-like protein
MNRKIHLKISLYILLSIITFSMLIKFTVNSETYRKKILFISSYSENFASVPYQKLGLKSVFDKEKVILDVEYMDTKRFDNKESEQVFYEYIKYKINNLPPYDAIIVGDDSALNFSLKYREELFSEKPIIFLGINDIELAVKASKDKYITGVIDETSIKDNIEIALKLHPKTKKVVAIVDGSVTGMGDKKNFYSLKDEFKDIIFDDLDISKYTYGEFANKLKELSTDTVLLHMTLYKDKDGIMKNVDDSIEFLVENSDLPIYRFSAGGLGKGIVGGKMISYEKSGQLAAKMVMDYFGGVPIEKIDMIDKSPNYYYFDNNLLEKYKINKNDLPENSIIINEEENFIKDNFKLFANILIFIIVLILIIIYILFDNVRRRNIEKELKETNDKLISTYANLASSEEELRSQYSIIQNQVEEITMLNQKYETAINNTKAAIWEINLKNNTINFSGSYYDLVNYKFKKEENVYALLDKLFYPKDAERILYEVRSYIKGERKEINIQIPLLKENKSVKWLLMRGMGVKDLKGNIKFIHGIFFDVTKMKEQEEYIEYLANHDYLTNLPNRMRFMYELNEKINSNLIGAVFLLDLDNFKLINDNLGHAYGDRVLIEVAKRLQTIVNDSFFVSRIGGDEFLILYLGDNDFEILKEIVLMINNLFKEPFVVYEKENYMSFSLGITRFPHDSNNIDELIMNADTAMYKVKKEGKNNYLFYVDSLKNELKENNEIEYILRDALKYDGFELVFQPQVNLNTGEVMGFEALLRIKDLKISPAKFIPIAEDTDMIIEIGRWVTTTAINQLKIWKENKTKLKNIAINFSNKQLKDKGYLEFLEQSIKESGVEPKYLEVEITESVLLERKEETIDFLNNLKRIGVKIALDDFGTGYSSLNYITFIPVDKIKLDKTLNDRFLAMKDIKVMKALISFVHSLDLFITAEGIENYEQYFKLKSIGCDFIQGYLFSKPIKINDVEEIYNKNYINDLKK